MDRCPHPVWDLPPILQLACIVYDILCLHAATQPAPDRCGLSWGPPLPISGRNCVRNWALLITSRTTIVVSRNFRLRGYRCRWRLCLKALVALYRSSQTGSTSKINVDWTPCIRLRTGDVRTARTWLAHSIKLGFWLQQVDFKLESAGVMKCFCC